MVLAFSYCEGGRVQEREGMGESSISEPLMSNCVPHTHLLFSEVDVGQSEVDCVQVGGVGDIVHCPLIAVLSRGEVPHQKVGVA